MVLQRFGIEAQFHVGRVMAGGAADAHVVFIEIFPELVEVLGPELVSVFLDVMHHLRRFTVPAGGGHVAFLRIAVDAVDMQNVPYGMGMPAGSPVFVAERIAEPEVFQVRLGMFVAFRQGTDVIIFVVIDRPTVLRHDFRFIVAHIGFIFQWKLGFEDGCS